MKIAAPLVAMAPTLTRPSLHRDGWIHEEKVDGWRLLAYKDGARVHLISRNAVEHTRRFRELAGAIGTMLTDTVVLSGEVAVYDEKLVSRFHLIGHHDRHAVDVAGVHRVRRAADWCVRSANPPAGRAARDP